jgi:hypothetical protein
MANTTEQQSHEKKGPAEPVSASSDALAASATKSARPAATIRYLDRPEIAETFADSISGLMFDGQVLRIEFAVTRLDDVKPDAPISGRRYPACRVVLSASGALDLINRVQQITAALRQAAAAKQPPPAGGSAE